MEDDCVSCGMPPDQLTCSRSKRPCGHHCNCSWTQDVCHWCGAEFGDVDEPGFGEPARLGGL